MNRLTHRNPNDTGYYFPECFERCCGVPGDCSECDVTSRLCEALAAYEDTGLSPEQIKALADPNHINIQSVVFAEVEEQLNAELSEAIRILKKSPMFEGRVTMAVVISNKGTSVRPILYRTKYTPSQFNPEKENLPGQLTFNEEQL